jgi:hypothetical protein
MIIDKIKTILRNKLVLMLYHKEKRVEINEPDYLFPISGGILTILGLILPLSTKNFESFFGIIFHNIEVNDLNINLLTYLMISLISISIVGCTVWSFKIINDAKRKKINTVKFETKMFVVAIILSLLGITLILIFGNAYLTEIFDNYTGYFPPYSMWSSRKPGLGFNCLVFGPFIIRFGTLYHTEENNTKEKKKVVIIKTLIVLNLLYFFIWYFYESYPGLDGFLMYLTILFIWDSGTYLFLKKIKFYKIIKPLVLASYIVIVIIINRFDRISLFFETMINSKLFPLFLTIFLYLLIFSIVFYLMGLCLSEKFY